MKKILYTAMSFAPVLALAQTVGGTESALTGVITSVKNLINSIIPVLIGLAVVFFFWGLVTYIRASGDEKKREEGKSQMIWGIVAIAIMVSLFGLIAWLGNAVGVGQGGGYIAPKI